MKRKLLKITGYFSITLGLSIYAINFLIGENSLNKIFGVEFLLLIDLFLIGSGYYLVKLSKNSQDKKLEKDMDDFWDSTSI